MEHFERIFTDAIRKGSVWAGLGRILTEKLKAVGVDVGDDAVQDLATKLVAGDPGAKLELRCGSASWC